MDKMRENGVTIFLVSHSSAQVRKVCRRALWLDHGQVKMIGPSEEVCGLYDSYCKE